MKKILVLSIFLLSLVGCQSIPPTSSSNPNANRANSANGMMVSMQLQAVDFQYAANKSVQEFLSSKYSSKPGGGRFVVAMGDVINDTTLDIRTASLTSQIKNILTKTDKFIFTGAVGREQTQFVQGSRQLNQSAMFDKKTTAKNNTVIAPELEMSGAIRQRTVTAGNKQAMEYEFDLRVVDAKSGLELFQSFVTIDKTGSNTNFAW